MTKQLMWLIICSILAAFDLCMFVVRSLKRDWLWAGIDWVCACIMLTCAMAWWYRWRVARRWRARHAKP